MSWTNPFHSQPELLELKKGLSPRPVGMSQAEPLMAHDILCMVTFLLKSKWEELWSSILGTLSLNFRGQSWKNRWLGLLLIDIFQTLWMPGKLGNRCNSWGAYIISGLAGKVQIEVRTNCLVRVVTQLQADSHGNHQLIRVLLCMAVPENFGD